MPYLSGETRVRLLAPSAIRIFWLYLSVILGVGIIGLLIFGFESQSLGFQVFASVVFAMVTIGVAVFHSKTLLPQLKRFGFLHGAAWVSLPILACLLLVNWFYHVWMIEWMGLSEILESESYIEIFQTYAATVFFVAVMPALTEEIAYRGLIQHFLHDALTSWKAIVLASALFSLSHFSIYSFPYLFAVGLLLGWVKWKTGSLYPSMLIHFLHNWAVITWMD